MREDYGSLPMNMHDDGFGEIGFDTPDLVRDGLNPTIDVSHKSGGQFGKIKNALDHFRTISSLTRSIKVPTWIWPKSRAHQGLCWVESKLIH